MAEIVRGWKTRHPDLYEFVLFNIMSNVATIVNFVILGLTSGFLFRGLADIPVRWLIFDYPVKKSGDGGLCGFLGFLTAYICAQIANFFVQRKVVFGVSGAVKKTLLWYILTVAVTGVISIWLPPHVMSMTEGLISGTVATYLANGVNIVVQVAINYPMMKFVIMKK